MWFDDFLKDQQVMLHFETAQKTIAHAQKYQFGEACRESSVRGLTFTKEIESPIEVIFLIWWEALTRASWQGGFTRLLLYPQYQVQLQASTYLLDFRVGSNDEAVGAIARHVGFPEPLIAIELDGHAFHERTREQVSYRNQRDRELQAAGWKVLHISGSELVNKPAVAVGGVMAAAADAYGDFQRAVLSVFTEQKGR